MKKNFYAFIFLLTLTTAALQAQKNEKEQMTMPVTKVTIVEPGIAHEFPIGYKTTLFLRTGLTATLATDYYNDITGVLSRIFGAASAEFTIILKKGI